MKRLAPVLLLGSAMPAAAVDFNPGAADMAAAVSAGAAIAARHNGYPAEEYLLYVVRDTRDLDPADGSVDAVTIATPLERARHAAYREVLSGRLADPARLPADATLPAGTLSVTIFAHGKDELDDAFPANFSPVALVLNGKAIIASETSYTPPSEGIYPLAKGDRERQVSAITCRFDLTSIKLAGNEAARLQFRDATGKQFDIPVALANFR